MQWGINDIQILLTVDDILIHHGLFHSHHVIIVHLSTDDCDEVLVRRKLHVRYLHLVHLIDDALVVRGKHLCAIVPISLVAIVLLRVMGSSDVHTALATQLTDSERDFRSRTETLEQVGVNTVGGEDISHDLREESGIVAAVMTYHHADLLLAGECLLQVVGETLGSHTHHVFVHAVGADTHDATKTSCTEFEVLVKSVNQIRFVGIVQ